MQDVDCQIFGVHGSYIRVSSGLLVVLSLIFVLQISPEDIRWEGEDPGISRRSGQGGPGAGVRKPMGQGGVIPGEGRGRGPLKNHSSKDMVPSTNGPGKNHSNDIEILHTDTLIKEVCHSHYFSLT